MLNLLRSKPDIKMEPGSGRPVDYQVCVCVCVFLAKSRMRIWIYLSVHSWSLKVISGAYADFKRVEKASLVLFEPTSEAAL